MKSEASAFPSSLASPASVNPWALYHEDETVAGTALEKKAAVATDEMVEVEEA